jgi:hypothetical protein
MYIISRFKDYYDSAQGISGIDKNIVYKRETVEIPIKQLSPIVMPLTKLELSVPLKKNDIYHNYNHFIIGFCGKFYVGFKLYKKKDRNDIGPNYYYYLKEVELTYDFNVIEQIIATPQLFQEQLKKLQSYGSSIFQELDTPIFIYDSGYQIHYTRRPYPVLFVNPSLKDYDFFKCVDPFTAFQEVQMFISGVLTNSEKSDALVSDEIKAAMKGFNEWSFRKPPQDPKKTKKK